MHTSRQRRSISLAISAMILVSAMLVNCGGSQNTTTNNSTPAPTFSVVYEGNGSTSGSVPTDPVHYNPGQIVTLLGNTGTLAKTGYAFVGWNTAANGTGMTYAQAQTFIIGTANVVLYAKWTTNPVYTVTYDGNGNTGGIVPIDSTSYEQGQVVAVLGNSGGLVKTGYVFAGWNTQADGAGSTYNGSFAMGSSNVTLYAKWTSNPTYTVTYDGNCSTGGSVPIDSVNYESGQSVTVLDNTGNLVKQGYTFAGWNTLANGTVTNYISAQTFVIGAANVTLYAKWNAIPTYSVTYDGNGKTGGSVPIDTLKYEQGSVVAIPGNTGTLVKQGYTFAGWNTLADGTGTTYTQGQTFVMGSANVMLYAKWTTNPTFTVTYDGNGNTGGSVPVDSTNYEQGHIVTVLGNTGILVKTGFVFFGWNTQADGTGTTYGPTFVMGPVNITLHAWWIADSLIFTPTSGAPGTTISLTTSFPTGTLLLSTAPTGTILNYQILFDNVVAPILGSGTAVDQYRIMVPIHTAGPSIVRVVEIASGNTIGSASFTVLPLPATGKVPGEVLATVLTEQKNMFTMLKTDSLTFMVNAGMMNPANVSAAQAEIDRAISILSLVETDMASLTEEEKMVVDQVLQSTGALNQVAQAKPLMSKMRRAALAGPVNDPYANHHFCAVMDGFSAILTTTKDMVSMTLLLASAVPGFQPLTAKLGVAVSYSLGMMDNLIDAFFPIDLVQLSIKLADGETELRVPLNNAKEISIMGKFAPQTDPTTMVVSEVINHAASKIPGIGKKEDQTVKESQTAFASYVVSALASYGLNAATPLSELGPGWQNMLFEDYRVDPAYYQGGLTAFVANFSQEFNVSYMPAFMANMGVMTLDQMIADTGSSIAIFDPATSSVRGIKEGATYLIMNGYAFKGPQDANVYFNLEKAQKLSDFGIKSPTIRVAKEIAFYPENGAVNVPTDAKLVITFLEDLDTLTTGTVTLGGTAYTVSNATFSIAQNALTVTLPAPFSPDTVYTGITVTGFKTDYTNVPIPGYTDDIYTFKTAQAQPYISYDWVTVPNGVVSNGYTGSDYYKFGRVGGMAQPSGYATPTYTEMLAYKNGPSSGTYADLTFNGDTVGEYLGNAYLTRLDSDTGFWTPGWMNVTVTRIDDVGGIIEGTFNGRLYWSAEATTYMNITNGKFCVKRVNMNPWDLPTYTVTYNGNNMTSGGVPTDTASYEQGQSVTVLGNTGALVKDGHAFAGWNTLADGTGITYSQGQSFAMGSANMTLYAKWTAL